MTDIQTTPAPASDATPAFSLDDIEKRIITLEELTVEDSEAVAYLQECVAVTTTARLPVTGIDIANPDLEIPDGMDLCVYPIKSRVPGGGGEVMIALAVLLIPTFEAIAAFTYTDQDTTGLDFVKTTVLDALVAKAVTAVRPRNGSKEIGTTILTDIQSFVSRARAGSDNRAFNELYKAVVDALAKAKLPVSKATLREVLSSTAAAAQRFPSIPATVWERILDQMIISATEKSLDPVGLMAWRDTRDQVAAEPDAIDLDSLANFML